LSEADAPRMVTIDAPAAIPAAIAELSASAQR
jgi:hypothetical protein